MDQIGDSICASSLNLIKDALAQRGGMGDTGSGIRAEGPDGPVLNTESRYSDDHVGTAPAVETPGIRSRSSLSHMRPRGRELSEENPATRWKEIFPRQEAELCIRVAHDTLIDAVVQIVRIAGSTTPAVLKAVLRNRCSEDELMEALAKARDAGIILWEGPEANIRTGSGGLFP